MRFLWDFPQMDCEVDSWHCIMEPAFLFLSETSVTCPASWRPSLLCCVLSLYKAALSPGNVQPVCLYCSAAWEESHLCPDVLSGPLTLSVPLRNSPAVWLCPHYILSLLHLLPAFSSLTSLLSRRSLPPSQSPSCLLFSSLPMLFYSVTLSPLQYISIKELPLRLSLWVFFYSVRRRRCHAGLIRQVVQAARSHCKLTEYQNPSSRVSSYNLWKVILDASGVIAVFITREEKKNHKYTRFCSAALSLNCCCLSSELGNVLEWR